MKTYTSPEEVLVNLLAYGFRLHLLIDPGREGHPPESVPLLLTPAVERHESALLGLLARLAQDDPLAFERLAGADATRKFRGL